jgi:glycosyltransferase involved in cell wall biosynthesis
MQDRKGNPWLTVVIPAYNEEAGLAQSIALLVSQLEQLRVASEILIIDDCSVDETGRIAAELVEKYSADAAVSVGVCRHATNLGIGAGLRTGISNAQGEWLILVPADLALDPPELAKYVDASASADIVVGVRSDRRDYTSFRRIVSEVNIALVRFLFRMNLRQYQYICMYRLAVLRAIDIRYWRSAFFHAEILIKARDIGYRLIEVEVRYLPRASGKATGANWSQIARTGRDMLRFWTEWLRASRRTAPGPT